MPRPRPWPRTSSATLGLPAATLAANCLTSCAALAAQDASLTRDGPRDGRPVLRPAPHDLLRDAARPGGDPTAPHHLIWFLVNCPVAEFRDPTEAIRMVQHLLERAPDSWVAWANLGAARYRAGNHRDAIEAFERAAMLNRGEILYYGFFLAMAHHRLDHKDQARSVFDHTDRWLQNTPWNEVAQQLRQPRPPTSSDRTTAPSQLRRMAENPPVRPLIA